MNQDGHAQEIDISFRRLGLSAEGEAVYLALLDGQNGDTEELSRRLGHSARTIRRARQELVQASLLRSSVEAPYGIRPVGPALAARILIERQEARILRLRAQVTENRAAVTAYGNVSGEAAWTRGKRRGLRQTVAAEAVCDRLELLLRGAQHEICAVVPREYRPLMRSDDQLVSDAIDRGVRLHIVWQGDSRREPLRLAELGGLSRTTPEIPRFFAVYDRELALAQSGDGEDALSVMETRDPVTVGTLRVLFDHAWSLAYPVDSEYDQFEAAPSQDERHLLTLLAQGLTDEVVARRLHVSVRTVRRITADLMTRLGARSRFQAGALAVERSWLCARATSEQSRSHA